MADNTQNTPQNISVIKAFEQLFQAQSKWDKFRPGQGEATFEQGRDGESWDVTGAGNTQISEYIDNGIGTTDDGHTIKTKEGKIVIGAFGKNASMFGGKSQALGKNSHAEGSKTVAFESNAHSEGNSTFAAGKHSHAEGNQTSALGNASHAEGQKTTAKGTAAHAEGSNTSALGDYSHASGLGTMATAEAQTVIGKYNNTETATFSTDKFVVGVGTASEKANAFTVGNDGQEDYITIGETKLTETQLKKILAFIDRVENV